MTASMGPIGTRFTVYLDGQIPLAHRPTLAAAVEAASKEPGAGYIVERDRYYPFTQRRAFTRDGTPLERDAET